MQNIKALGLLVKEKNVFTTNPMRKTKTHLGVAPHNPRAMILVNLVDNHEVMICAKYEASGPSNFREEDF